MKRVNIVFDNYLDDVDIIEVPNDILPILEKIVQEFFSWVPTTKDSDYWTVIDGQKCLAVETDGFIKWLNNSYCQKAEKACILFRHTTYCPEYVTIEF